VKTTFGNGMFTELTVCNDCNEQGVLVEEMVCIYCCNPLEVVL